MTGLVRASRVNLSPQIYSIAEGRVVILGIDPGIASCGWAVVDRSRPIDCGTLVTERDSSLDRSVDLARRTQSIGLDVASLVDKYGCHCVVAESALLHGNVRAAAGQLACWGALTAITAVRGLRLLSVRAVDWQRAVMGEGKIKYDVVAKSVTSFAGPLIDRVPKGQRTHAIDAIGIALYGLLRGGREI